MTTNETSYNYSPEAIHVPVKYELSLHNIPAQQFQQVSIRLLGTRLQLTWYKLIFPRFNFTRNAFSGNINSISSLSSDSIVSLTKEALTNDVLIQVKKLHL